MKPHVRKNDQVYVLTGRDKGKFGRVLEVYPDKQKVLVENINVVKRHTRPNPRKAVKGGIMTKEVPVHVSNVMLICPQCQKPTRVGHTTLQDGRKVRVCKRSGDVLEK